MLAENPKEFVDSIVALSTQELLLQEVLKILNVIMGKLEDKK
jgi:hypothetical protein